jgi:SsrA-binding protein
LHALELSRLVGAVERKGYTIVPVTMYWKNSRVKLEIALAKGKKQHDKRATEKDRDWAREKARIMSSKG